MSRSNVVLLGVFAGATVAQLAGLSAGWWPATLVTGLLAGALVQGARAMIAMTLATGGVWTALMWGQSAGRATEVADLVAAMATGASGAGWLVLVVTYVYALGSAFAGWWLGAALRRAWLAAAARTRPGTIQVPMPMDLLPTSTDGSPPDAYAPLADRADLQPDR